MMLSNVKSGDIIRLSDVQTILDMMEEGLSDTILNCVVSNVQTFEYNNSVRWKFIFFDDSELILLEKTVYGSDFEESELRIYYTPDDFVADNRQTIVENGCGWLFEPPMDESNFDYDELEYANEISSDPFTFYKKGPESYIEDELESVVITEWQSDDVECDNNQLICVETWNPNEKGSGLVELFQGSVVNSNDVEVFNRS